MPYVNNEDADQPVHLQSDQHLCYLLPRQYNASSFYIWNFKPLAVSVADKAGSSLTWSKLPKTSFLVMCLQYEPCISCNLDDKLDTYKQD